MVEYTFLCSGGLIAIILYDRYWILFQLLGSEVPYCKTNSRFSSLVLSPATPKERVVAKPAESVVHAYWEFHLALGQCCLELCPVR